MNETENQMRLRRAKEALEACRLAESEARAALFRASESTKKAKERYEQLFLAEELQEQKRRLSDYRHITA